MYLVLRTYVNGGNEDDYQARCAVLDIDREQMDYWLGMMDQAAGISAKLDKDITLSWMDYTPDYYAIFPASHPHDSTGCPRSSWLTKRRPFPEVVADTREESWVDVPAPRETVTLSYSEIRVSATAVSWWCGPKYGDQEEYTQEVRRDYLEKRVRPRLMQGALSYGK